MCIYLVCCVKWKNRTTTLADAGEEAMRNLDTMWMVGVVEQYAGFLELLRILLDPDTRQAL